MDTSPSNQDSVTEGLSASTLYLFILVICVSAVTFLCTILGNVCTHRVFSSRGHHPCRIDENSGGVIHSYSAVQPRSEAAPHQCQNVQITSDRRLPEAFEFDSNIGYEINTNRRGTESGTFKRLGIGERNTNSIQPLAKQLENRNLSPMHNTPPDPNEMTPGLFPTGKNLSKLLRLYIPLFRMHSVMLGLILPMFFFIKRFA